MVAFDSSRFALFLLLFSSFILGSHCLSSQIKRQGYLSNCVEYRELKIFKIDPQQHQRMLALSTPHNFMLYGHFPTSTTTGIDISILKKMFDIAAKYYQTVFKVTDIGAQNTRYDQSAGSCGIIVPQTYIQNGFDQANIDTVIFNVIENEPTLSHIARASACVHPRWPTYGYIKYNAPKIDTNLAKTGVFHNTVVVVMHQLAHALGMSSLFYSRHYGSYTNLVFIPESSVIQTLASSTKIMIVTPNVKNYVQTLFGCSDTSVGALLQDEGSSQTTAGSHFQRKVFFQEMMTASQWASGLKISGLTLNYFLDTGFFHSVDVSRGWVSFYGKDKGCQFALGQISSPPQFCTVPNSQQCDFYSTYGGSCSNTDTYANGALYIKAYSNLVCAYPQLAAGASTANFYFSSFSRCFKLSNALSCFQSACAGGSIQINIGSNSYLCDVQGENITTPLGTIKCPDSFDRFCSRSNCYDHCATQGLCIQGSCILTACSDAIQNCLTCTSDTLNRCTQCINNKFPTTDRLACKECQLVITNCQVCFNNTNSIVCNLCTNNQYPNQNNTACVSCSSIFNNCITCTVDNNQTKCIGCNNNLYPSLDRLSCQTCVSMVVQCASCAVSDGFTVCITCLNGKYPDSTRLACKLCSQIFDNCMTCAATSAGSRCSNCTGALFPNQDTGVCEVCNVAINDCAQCRNENGVTKCNTCSSLYLTLDNKKCLDCATIIPNCQTCSAVQLATKCQQCATNMFPDAQKQSCIACQNLIQNCNACYLSTDIVKCQTCVTGLFPNSENSRCMKCNLLFNNCQTCSETSGVTTCDLCIQKYLISNSECKRCTSPCLTCSLLLTNCTACVSGYYLTGNTCLALPNLIQMYAGTCTSGGKNVLCKQGCLVCTCSSLTSTSCTKTMKGYTISSGNTIKCQQGCETCQSTDSTICTKCFDRFTLNGSKCVSCDISCVSCLSTDINYCSSCSQLLYLDSFGQCKPCSIQNCLSCVDNACIQCADGHTLTQQGTFCQQCLINCVKCSQQDITQCLDCSYMFYLENGQCLNCPSGCLQCLSLTECLTCMGGYTKDQADKLCYTSCVFPCLTCSKTSPSSCQSCLTGYQLSNNACTQITACSGSCTSCPLGYSLSVSNNCEKCSASNCAQCSVPSTCQSCYPGYYLSSSLACVQCPETCKTCLNQKVCLLCNEGYTMKQQYATSIDALIQGSCYLCNPPCSTCIRSPNRCLTCVQGYQLKGWKCVHNVKNTISITIDSSFETFISNGQYGKFKKELGKKLGKYFQNRLQSYTGLQLKSGSTIITAQISNPPEITGVYNCQLSEMLSATLSQGATFEVGKIIQSSIISSTDEMTCPQIEKYIFFGAIAAVVAIPVLIVVLIIAIVCIKKKISQKMSQDASKPKKKKKQVHPQEQSQQKNLNDYYEKIARRKSQRSTLNSRDLLDSSNHGMLD